MPPLRPSVAQALESFKVRVHEEFGSRVCRIVLFGSAARGEDRWDSDVDVLVTLDRVDWRTTARVIDLAADQLTERMVLISPTVMSEQELARLERNERLLAQDIARDGIPL